MKPCVAGSIPAGAAREPKLYVIARRDLDVGLRTAQVGHALIEWTCQHGRPPDNLVVLSVDDEVELLAVERQLRGRVVCFEEPDLDNEVTAVAVGPEGAKQLSSLPLLR